MDIGENEPLTPELVADFKTALRASGWPGVLTYGALEDEIVGALRSLGLDVPPELLLWMASMGPGPEYEVVPGTAFYLLAEATEEHQRNSSLMSELYEDEHDVIPLKPNWFPVARNRTGQDLLIDTTREPGAVSRVAIFDHRGVEDEPRVVAMSLGRVVRGWFTCLSEGAFVWNASDRAWESRDGLVPPGTDVLD